MRRSLGRAETRKTCQCKERAFTHFQRHSHLSNKLCEESPDLSNKLCEAPPCNLSDIFNSVLELDQEEI